MMCTYLHCYCRRWPDNWSDLRSATAKEQADMIQIAVRQATERRQRPRRHDAISSVREAAIVTLT